MAPHVGRRCTSPRRRWLCCWRTGLGQLSPSCRTPDIGAEGDVNRPFPFDPQEVAEQCRALVNRVFRVSSGMVIS